MVTGDAFCGRTSIIKGTTRRADAARSLKWWLDRLRLRPLDVGCWMFDVGCSMFCRKSRFRSPSQSHHTIHSASVRSMLDVRCSAAKHAEVTILLRLHNPRLPLPASRLSPEPLPPAACRDSNAHGRGSCVDEFGTGPPGTHSTEGSLAFPAGLSRASGTRRRHLDARHQRDRHGGKPAAADHAA